MAKQQGIRGRIRNLMGDWLHFGRCDGCGETLWHNGRHYHTIYTKVRLPKTNYRGGTSCWHYCSKCEPSWYVVAKLIKRTYINVDRSGMVCTECGRFHPSNVCYSEMSEEEVRTKGCGFPFEVGRIV